MNANLSRIAKNLGHAAVNNSLALLALVVAIVSLAVSWAERQEVRQKEGLAATMTSELVGRLHAAIDWPTDTLSPFEPPYLRLPVRLFVMNRSSLPQSIIGLWVTFDEGPEEQLRYVDVEEVRETNGSKLAWPKTIPPWAAIGIDVIVPVPIAPETAKLLGARRGSPVAIDLGPANRLVFAVANRAAGGTDTYQRLRRQARFEVRLLSASPGSPMRLPYSVALP